MLARSILAFTVDHEAESRLSLPLTADVLASLTGLAIPLRKVPLLGGVSQEAAKSALGFLERHGLVVTGQIRPAGAARR